MWKRTRVTRLLKIQYPIIQGPFGGGPSSTLLAATVSNAGGLGSFGSQGQTPAQMQATIAELRTLTSKPFAINLWVPIGNEEQTSVTEAEFTAAVERMRSFYDEVGATPPPYSRSFLQFTYAEKVAALLEAAPPAFSFVFGIPSPAILDACKARGIVTLGTATNLAEAVALDRAGVDLIVATGNEAGGHRVTFIGNSTETPSTTVLVSQVTAHVKTPVIAAGGIIDGRTVAAAFAVGAEAVQIGTGFLACDESNAPPAHKAALRTAQERVTVLTNAFSGRFARGIKNRFIEEMATRGAPAPFPIQNFLTQPLRAAAAQKANADLLSLWAGQNVHLVKHTKARDYFEFLLSDTDRAIKRLTEDSDYYV